MGGHAALNELSRRLDALADSGLYRSLSSVGHATGPRVTVRGRRCLLMASNDYLGLTNHPRLAEASLEAVVTQGAGTGASRLVSGTLDCHTDLEKRLAAFKGCQAALYFSTGYMTNLAAVAGLAGPGDLVVSDELNHASIVDACRLSRAKIRVYPHLDAKAAGEILSRGQGGLKLLVTDGVFSMDGDMAPLPGLLAACRENQALLLIDDAHATGVWGQRGRGSLEHYGIPPEPDIAVVGTCSKALGGAGGFVAGCKEVIDTLIHRARSLLYTTAPPPSQVGAVMAALDLVDEEAWRRSKVHELSKRMRQGLAQMGRTVPPGAGPIIPVMVGGAQQSLAVAENLWKHGVFAPAMRPPTVPRGASRVRMTVTAAHEERNIDQALEAVEKAFREAGL